MDTRLCPVCRKRYFDVWVGYRGRLFYVHKAVRQDEQWTVTGCALEEGMIVRGVMMESHRRKTQASRKRTRAKRSDPDAPDSPPVSYTHLTLPTILLV